MDYKYESLKKKSFFSIFSLFFQSGYSSILGLVANLAVTMLLSKETYGLYFTVLSIISILNYFSDIGLAASLIQKKEISDDDVKTTFTIQQFLVISILAIGFLATGFIEKFYRLPFDAVVLYQVLLFSFFISSLKTMPSIFLERQIKFQKIVLVQVVENTLFYTTVIVLALSGLGIKSFTFAVLIRSLSGLVLIYSLSFWIPKIGISLRSAKQLLAFGIPFQSTSLLALIKDDLMTLYLAKVLGFGGVGYIGWAKKWAEAPLRIIMDNLSKVLFPVLSRLQKERDRIGTIVEKILYYQSLVILPATIGLAFVMTILVFVLPNYNKWIPALPILYLFCLSASLSSFTTPFTNLFNSQGKIKISFFFMIFWTVSTWILTPFLTNFFGVFGFPITQAVLSLSFLPVVYIAKKIVKFQFVKSVIKPTIASCLMALILFNLFSFLDKSYLSLALLLGLGLTSYYLIFLLLFRINLITQLLLLIFHEK